MKSTKNTNKNLQILRIFLILPVILFAFNYLRNLAVSPRESFPICKKNGLKLSPIRCTIFPIGDSLGSKTKVREYRVSIRNVIFLYRESAFEIRTLISESTQCLKRTWFSMVRYLHFFRFFPLPENFPSDWKCHTIRNTMLKTCAYYCMFISSSTAVVERSFSLMSNILTAKRNRMTQRNLDATMRICSFNHVLTHDNLNELMYICSRA